MNKFNTAIILLSFLLFGFFYKNYKTEQAFAQSCGPGPSGAQYGCGDFSRNPPGCIMCDVEGCTCLCGNVAHPEDIRMCTERSTKDTCEGPCGGRDCTIFNSCIWTCTAGCGAYGAFGDCSNSCGTGTMTQTRTCTRTNCTTYPETNTEPCTDCSTCSGCELCGATCPTNCGPNSVGGKIACDVAGCETDCTYTCDCVNCDPGTPSLSSPASGTTFSNVPSVDLFWNDLGNWGHNCDGANDHYQLCVGDSSASCFAEINNLNKETNTSHNFTRGTPSLDAGTYYWKLRASNGARTSGYSSTWNFQVLQQPKTCTVTVPPTSEWESWTPSNPAVSISMTGNALASDGNDVRLFVERIDGGSIQTANIDPFIGHHENGGVNYYHIGGCPSGMSDCVYNQNVSLLSQGNYFFHCDIPQQPRRCSGNPFCSFEVATVRGQSKPSPYSIACAGWDTCHDVGNLLPNADSLTTNDNVYYCAGAGDPEVFFNSPSTFNLTNSTNANLTWTNADQKANSYDVRVYPEGVYSDPNDASCSSSIVNCSENYSEPFEAIAVAHRPATNQEHQMFIIGGSLYSRLVTVGSGNPPSFEEITSLSQPRWFDSTGLGDFQAVAVASRPGPNNPEYQMVARGGKLFFRIINTSGLIQDTYFQEMTEQSHPLWFTTTGSGEFQDFAISNRPATNQEHQIVIRGGRLFSRIIQDFNNPPSFEEITSQSQPRWFDSTGTGDFQAVAVASRPGPNNPEYQMVARGGRLFYRIINTSGLIQDTYFQEMTEQSHPLWFTSHGPVVNYSYTPPDDQTNPYRSYTIAVRAHNTTCNPYLPIWTSNWITHNFNLVSDITGNIIDDFEDLATWNTNNNCTSGENYINQIDSLFSDIQITASVPVTNRTISRAANEFGVINNNGSYTITTPYRPSSWSQSRRYSLSLRASIQSSVNITDWLACSSCFIANPGSFTRSGNTFNCSYNEVVYSPKTQDFPLTNVNLDFDAWFQSVGGNIAASSGINSPIPHEACSLNSDCQTALITWLPWSGSVVNSPGFPFTQTGNINTFENNSKAFIHDSAQRNQSSGGYAIGSGLFSKTYDYDFFYNKFGFDFVDNTLYSLAQPELNDELNVFLYTPSDGMAVLSDTNPWAVESGQQAILFINGDLVISDNRADGSITPITAVETGGYLAFIVRGNIIIEPSVGNPYLSNQIPHAFSLPSNTSHLEGVFIASNQLTIASYNTSQADRKFVGEGTYVGWSGVNLNRDFDDIYFGKAWNALNPTETFIYRPDFLLNAPMVMKQSIHEWREVAPRKTSN